MIKNFNSNVVLTSQTKEAILTFTYDGTNMNILPWYDTSVGISSFYVNGIDFNVVDSSSIKLDASITSAVFHIFTKSASDFDIKLKFYNNSFDNLLTEVSVYNRPFVIDNKNFNLYPNDKPIIDNEASHLVLRTNPKFSGNIKLVVDSSNNLYLDTFKVSDILSNKKYRKQQVSANSVFSADIRKVFSSIPNGELHKASKENTLDIALPKTTLDKQFNTTYSYGAVLFRDELYPEDYSILAPLWINTILPDFFAVFRLDGAYNMETYNTDDTNKIEDLATKYFKNSDLIKSWSINKKDNLGKYLYSHLNELKNVPSPIYMPLSDYDHNVWNGISINKGVINSNQETSYQFEKTVDNFTDMNAFISTGFERNNTLCPHLINLEYAFNDNNANMYSMHRYFGLYLSENVMYKIAYYKENSNDNTFRILELDGSISNFLVKSNDSSTSIFDINGNLHDKFKNRIFAINDSNILTRITSVDQINYLDYVNGLCNKVGDNIFTTNTSKKNISQFISISLNDVLHQGDHFRVINKNENTIWEVYGINMDMINIAEPYAYCSKFNDDFSELGYPKVYRNAYSTAGTMEDQIDAIVGAFNSFSEFDVENKFVAYKNHEDTFSIVIDETCNNDFSFQHISSQQILQNETFTRENLSSYVNFFGQRNADTLYTVVELDALVGPINFEYHGNRKNVIADFVKNENNLYSITNELVDKFQPYMYYNNINGYNKLMVPFDVSINGNTFTYQYVQDPTSDQDNIVLNLEDKLSTSDGKLYAYSVYSINISLMGVNSVKDFDFNVYDKSLPNDELESEYFYKKEDDKLTFSKTTSTPITISERGSYIISQGTGNISVENNTYGYDTLTNNKFNTFFGPATLTPSSETTITYSVLDGSQNFLGYKSTYYEENIYSYYANDSSSMLKYSLTSPYVTKWVAQGFDCRNNEMRLILDVSSSFDSNKVPSNFIPVLDNSIFSNEISFPSFKSLSLDNKSSKDYVYYDINDVIVDGSTRVSIKDAMILKPYSDIFSKLMFSGSEDGKTINRTSILSYNKYKNSIDTIYSGLKISLSSNKDIIELASIENYNKYKFGFISTASRNYSNNMPIEVIINENTRSVLMIWYQGNDISNIYYRNSSYNIGKSICTIDASRSLSSFYYGKENVSTYNFAKSPFWLRTNTVTITTDSLDPQRDDFTEEESSNLAQLAFNTNNIGNIFVSYADTSVNNNVFNHFNKTYNNFGWEYQYGYTSGNSYTVGSNVINHCSTYGISKNLYSSNTCDINVLNSIFQNNKVFYTILREDKLYNTNTFGDRAFSMSIISPKSYKNKLLNHSGAFFPKFLNVLNFSSNEDSTIIDIAKKDFIIGNTNLTSYENAPQMWYNKIVYNISEQDRINKNAIQYETNYNYFKSLWDRSYYTVFDTSANEGKGSSNGVDGYQSSVELPSFFGSKLIKLPYDLTLSNWDNLNSTAQYLNNDVILKFNISLSIKRIVKNNPTFILNWAYLPNSDQFIDKYITDTILSYYSMNMANLKVKLYSKNTGNLLILNSYSSDLIEMSNGNFYSELLYDKGEYFYVINIKNTYNNLSYYVEININQK